MAITPATELKWEMDQVINCPCGIFLKPCHHHSIILSRTRAETMKAIGGSAFVAISPVLHDYK